VFKRTEGEDRAILADKEGTLLAMAAGTLPAFHIPFQ
jgi:hypothetical protein